MKRYAEAAKTKAPLLPDQADLIIRNHVAMALAAGLVPVGPAFNVVAVTAIEVHMIARLAAAYSAPVPSRHVAAKMLVSLVGGVAPAYLSLKSLELLRGTPVVREIVYLGGLSLSGGASVYVVGKIFQKHFESGGTFLSGDNRILRSFFEEKRKEAKVQVPLMLRGLVPAN
jgi:uncharacterized protein (DUF697 family)